MVGCFVFRYMLSFGNYLNGGDAKKGQSDGFTLESMCKLSDTKDILNKTTLLQACALVGDGRSARPDLPSGTHACTHTRAHAAYID